MPMPANRYTKKPDGTVVLTAKQPTAAELAETAGVGQDEVMEESRRIDGLPGVEVNSDALVGNVMEKQRQAANVTTSTLPPGAKKNKYGVIEYPDGSYQYGENGPRYGKDGKPMVSYEFDPNVNPETGEYDGARKRYLDGLDTTVTEDEIAEIKRQEQEAMQQQLDAIGGVYLQERKRDSFNNQNDLGRQRAMAARGGKLNSTMGESERLQVVENNQVRDRATDAREALAKAAVFKEISANVQRRVDAAKADADKNSETYLNGLKELRDEARGTVAQLAKSGQPLSSLTDEEYKKLLESTEYDDFELKMIYNSNLPEEKKIKYESRIENGKLIVWGVDPATGKPTMTVEDVEGLEPEGTGSYKPQVMPDGTLLFMPEVIDPDRPLDEQVIRYGSEGQFARKSAGGGGSSSSEKQSKKELADRQTELDNYALDMGNGVEVPAWAQEYLVPKYSSQGGERVATGEYESKKLTDADAQRINDAIVTEEESARTAALNDVDQVAQAIEEEMTSGKSSYEVKRLALEMGVPEEVFNAALRQYLSTKKYA